MGIHQILDWLHALPLADAIRTSGWLFPALESAHVIAATLVVGTVAIVDLRLLGVTSSKKPVTELSTEVLPWTWIAFAVAVLTGFLMFLSRTTVYFENIPFRLKMCSMLLAGINMLFFEFVTFRSVKHWDREVPTLVAARVAGVTSLGLWILVVTFARWIGFTTVGS